MTAVRNEVLKTNVVKRQVILADGTILRNEQVPEHAGAAKRDEKSGEVIWTESWKLRRMDAKERVFWSVVKTFKPGKNTQYVLNGWTIGWCYVVADSPVKKSAATAAKKAVNGYIGEAGAQAKAWPYMVDGVECDVISDHACSIPQAAEKGRKMADALLKYGITSRVYVMTDKQFGMGSREGDNDLRARQGRSLKGIRLTTIERVGRSTTWTLTVQQSTPVHQTSL